MSRVFDNNTSNWLSVAASVSPGQDLSMAAYVKPDVTNLDQIALSLSDDGATANPRINLAMFTDAKARAFEDLQDLGNTSVYSTTTMSSLTWQLIVFTYTFSSKQIAIYNNTNTAYTTTGNSGSFTGTMDRIGIGQASDSTPSGPFDGKIAQAAIWTNKVLSGTDVQALLDANNTAEYGAVQSGSLYCHYPLTGGDLFDRTGTLSDLTVNGTVALNTDDPIDAGSVYINDATTLDGGEVLQTYPGTANWSDTSIDMQSVPDTTGLTGQLYVIVELPNGSIASRAVTVGTDSLPSRHGANRGIARGVMRGVG